MSVGDAEDGKSKRFIEGKQNMSIVEKMYGGNVRNNNNINLKFRSGFKYDTNLLVSSSSLSVLVCVLCFYR